MREDFLLKTAFTSTIGFLSVCRRVWENQNLCKWLQGRDCFHTAKDKWTIALNLRQFTGNTRAQLIIMRPCWKLENLPLNLLNLFAFFKIVWSIINGVICYREKPKWPPEDPAEREEWFSLFVRIAAMGPVRERAGWVRSRRRRSTPTSTAPGCAPPSWSGSKGMRRGRRKTSTRRSDNISLQQACQPPQWENSHRQLFRVVYNFTGHD